MHTRHGLPTVELGEPGEDRRLLTALVLARGAGTLIQVRCPAESQAVVVGDRLLLVDHAGRSAAVLEVDAVEHTTVELLGVESTAEDHAHERGGLVWAAHPSNPSVAIGKYLDRTTSVVCLSFHVVGHETAQTSPGQAAAQAPQQEGLLLEE